MVKCDSEGYIGGEYREKGRIQVWDGETTCRCEIVNFQKSGKVRSKIMKEGKCMRM